MLPAHFSLKCHISHLQNIQDTNTNTPRWRFSLPTNFTGDVSWCDWLLHIPWDDSYPRNFPSRPYPHISAITAQHTCNHNVITALPLLDGLFLVFHSMACAFFLLFLQIWMSMPHWRKATIKKKKQRKGGKNKNLFPNCGGWGFGIDFNFYQGCRVRNTAGGSSRHPTSS